MHSFGSTNYATKSNQARSPRHNGPRSCCSPTAANATCYTRCHILSSMPRNKNRIYMAFYPRDKQDQYHMAILVSPKNPKHDDANTWRLHVMNTPNLSRPTQQKWRYDSSQVVARTARLSALCLLDKTQMSGEEISALLRTVELVQDDMRWNCKSWALSAVQASQLVAYFVPTSNSLTTLSTCMTKELLPHCRHRSIACIK